MTELDYKAMWLTLKNFLEDYKCEEEEISAQAYYYQVVLNAMEQIERGCGYYGIVSTKKIK